jgi:putative Holliday junction resolvase
MKIAALDLGNVWTGVALSDPLGITVRPYETIPSILLNNRLEQIITKEELSVIVVGDPQTLRGTISAQTIQVRGQVENLQRVFPLIRWVLWDERLTSKQAAIIKPARDKKNKEQQHAIAAALILRSYLDHLIWQQEHKNNNE